MRSRALVRYRNGNCGKHMYDGIINVYKEAGFTSFDVVAKLRGILHQKKIGHTGTLDPEVEGVLVVCLGKATKLCDILPDHDKVYEATLLLGTVTDTEDTTGEVLNSVPVGENEFSMQELEEVIDRFRGSYLQIPPMYSAIKKDGKKLYEYARQGQEVVREPRPVTIHQLEIISVELPRVLLRVSCSRGTYIRSLCRDIGEKLGCGGCMEHLVRTQACGFDISDSLKLGVIETLAGEDKLIPEIHSVDSMYPGYPKLMVKKEYERLLYNGNKLQKRHVVQIREELNTEFDAEHEMNSGDIEAEDGSNSGVVVVEGDSNSGVVAVEGDSNSGVVAAQDGLNPIMTDSDVKFLVYDSGHMFTAIYEYDLETQEYIPYKMFL